ncbi:energy-coupling factor transporter transmembrane protein EcfT [Methanolobus sp. ZRKC3]|uniref:energy-coupling factor transporter transmembrane component T family protein n=1 Tax=Methanolobus sp. ZRKC3 TaxID=3125786 RepID=UPI003253F7CA
MSNLFFSYVPGNSLLHRLDPRTKIIAVMLASILIFRSGTFSEMLAIAIIFIFLLFLSSLSLNLVLDSLRPMSLILSFIFIIQLFFTEGVPMFSLLGLNATYEGLLLGSIITLRFAYLLMFASLLTATTASSLITAGIERLLRPLPLKVLGISSFDLAVMMSMSLHFVPLLYNSFRDLKDAQVSRGLNMRHNPFKAVYSLSVPMIRAAFRMAEEVAVSMESRCYQGVHRSCLFELRMRGMDWTALAIVALLFVVVF